MSYVVDAKIGGWVGKSAALTCERCVSDYREEEKIQILRVDKENRADSGEVRSILCVDAAWWLREAKWMRSRLERE